MYRLLFFILLTQTTWANPNEMLSDKELEKKFVSIVKENEIEALIKKTKDFDDCRGPNAFVATDSPTTRSEKAKKAQECFQNKFAGKSSKEIQKLSDNLGLESYQLVKSKNVKDITSYLGKRMYTALTGVSEEDQKNKIKLANLKFKDKQLVDQKEFFKLYSYQLTKNALLEVSRFCFQNFTNDKDGPSATFADHWQDYFSGKKVSVSDTANHKWGDLSESAEPNQAYAQIFGGMGNIDPKKLNDFWQFCTEQMKVMCDAYKPDSESTRGANSCLSINRLRNIRNAITASEKTEEYMNDKMNSGAIVGLDNGENANFFQVGKKKNTSYDDLTNISSIDLLQNPDQKFQDTITRCKDQPGNIECDQFIAEGATSSEEIIHKIDQEMMLKQEAEIARILKIKEEAKIPLKEYFEQNGYFELAEKDEISEKEIREFLAKNFEAQRKAVTERLKNTVGSRQIVSEADDKESKSDAIRKAATDTEQERARLAQVILFNNIITSNLSLMNTEGVELSKNVGAWKKESDSLMEKNIDQSLYENIQGVIDTSGGAANNNSIKGTEFIDMIIGKSAPQSAK